ncbi:MAG: phosphoglucosamine mutase [Spirochaetota bacterium]|nr:MAG: phosphoglucosamine mutase [Spirochaetota bacterium]
MPLMVSVSGIRGIIGESLTPEVIMNYVISFIKILGKDKGALMIGRDTRGSGKSIEKIIEGIVTSLGYDVINIGVAPTPTILLCTRKLGCIGGIAITASHNPAEWNALKFCNEKGLFLGEDIVKVIERQVNERDFIPQWVKFDKLGRINVKENAIELHIKEVMNFIDVELIRSKHYTVAIDPVGGSSVVIDRKFLENLGCTVVEIHGSQHEIFPRGSEPTPENIGKLCSLVNEHKADIGFAQDPDGDRLSIVSEQGIAIGEEYTLILVGESWLRNEKSNIVCNLSTSMMVEDLAKRFGVEVMRTKIGEIWVTQMLLDRGLSFGGEGNGGAIVIPINPCRDSILAMGLILELMAKTDRSISQIVDSIPAYFMKKDKVSIKKTNREDLYKQIKKLAEELFSNYEINTLDGIKIYNNQEWVHIRLSNTEPVVRIVAESETITRTEELIAKGKLLTTAYQQSF